MKHGPEYLWLWTRLALKFANYGGVLCRRIGEMVYPVTADDLEAEMKGGFTDVSIKDGVKTLIDASLIYINSDGFMAITGLTITGDPKEPVLHRQNSNENIVRPLSVGKDSRSAQYQRTRRKITSQAKDLLLLTGPDEKLMSYTEIVKITRCSKTTVANRIKKHSLENHVVTVGQKKYLPKPIAQYLICLIKGTPIPKDISNEVALLSPKSTNDLGDLDSLDSLDGLDGCHKPSNTVNLPSNLNGSTVHQPSNLDSEPSNDETKKPYKFNTLDGLSNDNQFDNPNDNPSENPSLFESKENKNNDDRYLYKSNLSSEPDWFTLFSVGFDRQPEVSDISSLMELYNRFPYTIILNALKSARKYHADSIRYVTKCAEQSCHVPDGNVTENMNFDPNRSMTRILSMLQVESLTPEETAEMEEEIMKAKCYWSDQEILKALVNISAYRAPFNKDYFDFFLKNQYLESSQIFKKLQSYNLSKCYTDRQKCDESKELLPREYM
jgi:hypothetical protein